MKFDSSRPIPPQSAAAEGVGHGNDLRHWFESPVGRYLLSCEQQVIDGVASHSAGYRAVLVKALVSEINIDQAPQLHRFVLAPFRAEGVAALAEPDALPLPSSAVDLALLHHVLDFSDFPHEALKEAARVVQASGHLVVVGFNPWSFFGLFRLVGRWRRGQPIWRSRCLSVGRVVDWLRFVGFQVEKVGYGAYRPPIQAPRVLSRLGVIDRLATRLHLPCGGFYVVVARKIRLRPIRGRAEWLPAAINPVKLASRASVQKSDQGN